MTTSLLLPALLVAAGDVLTVDDDGGARFTRLQAAVDAAQPGDVVLVRDGDYGEVAIAGKGVDVVAEEGERFRVARLVVQGVPAGERVLVRRLDAAATFLTGGSRVAECQGSVWLEECTFAASAAPLGADAGLEVVASLDVVLIGSTTTGAPAPLAALAGRPGLSCLVSNVAVHGGRAVGGAGLCPVQGAPDGGPGIAVHGGALLLAGATVAGGDGAPACVVAEVCYAAGGDGGPALLLDGGGAVVHRLDAPLVPGAGGAGAPSPACPGGGPGLPVEATDGVVVDLAGEARAFTASSPARVGATTTLSFAGLPGDLVLAGWSLAPARIALPPLGGWLHVLPTSVVLHGVLDGGGALQVTLPIPPLPPSVQGVTLLQQAGFVAASGAALLGPPASLTILGARP